MSVKRYNLAIEGNGTKGINRNWGKIYEIKGQKVLNDICYSKGE